MEPTSTVLIMLDRETGRVARPREFLLEHQPERRGQFSPIEPAGLPADGEALAP